MIKLIPLIIFPLSFFLIFLGVKNLTVNFPLEKEKITQNDKKEMIKYNQNSEDVEKKIVKEKEQNFIDVDENKKNTKEIEKQFANEVKEKESENRGSLEKSEQILVFLNRRGYAPIAFCTACRVSLECKNCSAKLVYHKTKRQTLFGLHFCHLMYHLHMH